MGKGFVAAPVAGTLGETSGLFPTVSPEYLSTMPPLLRRRPTVSWFCAGTALSALCFWSLSSWFTIANDWLGLRITYDTRPWWLVSAMTTASLLPWLSLGLVVLLRRWRGAAYRATDFGSGILAPYLLALGCLLLLPTLDDHWHRREFDAALWKANRAADPLWPDRLCMVDDLLAHVTFVGLPQEHVVELLGPGDRDRVRNGWDAVYELGPERGAFRMDKESLAMRFSRDGRVVESRILVD